MRHGITASSFLLGTLFVGLLLSQTLLASDFDDPSSKFYQYCFSDGVKIRVHFNESVLKKSGQTIRFAKNVLDSAIEAYQIITQFKGFSSAGYSFAFPDTRYAYDPDKTIDIYLGDPSGDDAILNRGQNRLSFKDAPCFDTIKLSDTVYKAVILLPSNYRDFIKNWEHINPSPLGVRDINVDLRGTLIHEMLHVILFYYNKNLNKESWVEAQGSVNAEMKVDWYVEGLARYFEMFAGARHDFFSQGFKQTFPDKIRFSRGGSNFFMRYPDQAFTDLRYENALFWRFIDYKYGMAVIERLSRNFRLNKDEGLELALAQVTKTPFNELLKSFAMAILFNDFGLKEDEIYLKEIAKTHLVYQEHNLYLIDGFGDGKLLGKVCATDWIGKWGGISSQFGNPGAGGDNTEKADVSGWATDYIQIDIGSEDPSLPTLGVTHKGKGLPLAVQLIVVSKGGSTLTNDMGEVDESSATKLNLKQWVGEQGLLAQDIDKVYLLITNTDPRKIADYEIHAA
ncbi:MAG: hypothetical protein AUJ72_00020 [Candidatus Omnitrophica bacterium CG1_02_46_14]|nr:MAG: hypothetical protein AUJ72_00020 [Candidatus Omnitrophica bacterium CG1_02_46_14]